MRPSIHELYPTFCDGDIVKVPMGKQLFRLSRVQGHTACFEPVKKDGSRDHRWYVGFSGSTCGYILVKRSSSELEQQGGEA